VKPRQVAMYLSKVMTPRSLPEIGRRFGGRDHTTVLHAVRKIEDLSGADNTLAQELELLRRLINDQARGKAGDRPPQLSTRPAMLPRSSVAGLLFRGFSCQFDRFPTCLGHVAGPYSSDPLF